MSNHTKLYGICQNKCMVEITSKAEQETKDSAQDSKITTLEGDVSALETTVAGKQDTITAGTGLSKSGVTINHSNSVTAKTSYVGGTTSVPMIKYDAQGHITGTSTANIYPPTTVGTAGQYWESDGTAAGTWVTKDTAPTKDSTKAVTSGAVYTALSGKAASSHTHDDRYYTETEMDTKLSGKADASALSAKQDKVTGGASTITGSNLTANRALISNADGKVAVSAVTSTELGYLDGVTSAIQTQINGKQATMSAGTGIALNGATINHSNSVTAATSYVGSATKVPMIKYDAQGHITGTTTATIYPPTTVGTAGQIWASDGTGAGDWQTLDTAPTADSTKAITSGAVKTAVDGKVSKSGDEMTGDLSIKKESPAIKLRVPTEGGYSDVITFGADGNRVGLVRVQDIEGENKMIFGTCHPTSHGLNYSMQIINNATDGIYALAPSWSVGTNDNSDKILTIKMANSLPSLVHRYDAEQIDGEKTLTGITHFTHSYAMRLMDTEAVKGTAPTSDRNKRLIWCDKNKADMGGIEFKYGTDGTVKMNFYLVNDVANTWDLSYFLKSDGTRGITAPATPNNANGKEIATANWVNNKLTTKQDTVSAGSGLALDGTTINHSNSVTASTSYVGSATKVPMIKYDAQGHITACTTTNIYPPTTVGSAGQIWVSDGSGAGTWKHKITMSTSDPSGGSDGDIWFKYE